MLYSADFTGPISLSLLRSAGGRRPSVTSFTKEGSEYVDPSTGRVTICTHSPSDDLDFAFLADLAGDGSTEVDAGGVTIWVAAAPNLALLVSF